MLAVAEVRIEALEDGEAIAAALQHAVICYEVDNATEWCAERGSGEAAIFDLEHGWHSMTASATSPQIWGAVSERVHFEVAGPRSRCGERHPFPVAPASRRVAEAGHRQRNGNVELKVHWPRPGEIARSPILPVKIDKIYANKSAIQVDSLCLSLRWLDAHDGTESCLEMAGDIVEMKLDASSSEGWMVLEVRAGLLTAPPIELYFWPLEYPSPPLGDTLGWIVSPERAEASLGDMDMVLVLSHWREDLSWIRYQPFPVVVYEKRPQSHRHSTPRNTANEASAYLKFIVDYYDRLPQAAAFLHSHRHAYHQEDLLSLLNDLDPPAQWEGGYCNLNSVVWGTREDPSRALLYRNFSAWAQRHLGPLPPLLLDRCCAQFAVTRTRILSRPRSFYEDALAVALDPALNESDREQNRQRGLLFEWLWHHIFGQQAVNPDLRYLVPNLHHTDMVYAQHRPHCVTAKRAPNILP